MYNAITNKYEGYIYVIKNKINSKVYIGQTIKTIEERFRQHRNAINYISSYPYHLYFAMLKHGVENFYIEELKKIESDTQIELNELLNTFERQYISQYDSLNNGYNMTAGGQSTFLYDQKIVYQFNLFGDFVAEYKSVSFASQITNIDSGHISACCLGYKNTAGGFRWSYQRFNNDFNNNTYFTPVIQYDLHGTIIKKYTSIKEAVAETNYSKSSILLCCQGKSYQNNGSIWRYADDDFNKYPKTKKFQHRMVYQFDKDFNFINEYQTAQEAGRVSKVATGQNIRMCCNHKSKQSGGYYWFFADEIINKYDKKEIEQAVNKRLAFFSERSVV